MKSVMKDPVWVCWRYVNKRKVPYTPGKETPARSNDPKTWRSYEEAVEASALYNGTGFMFYEGLGGIDIDGHVSSRLTKAIRVLFGRTYQERSPSGKGLHILFKVDLSKLPGEYRGDKFQLDERFYIKNPHNGLEAYVGGFTNRFFTYTGDVVSSSHSIVDCTAEFLTFLKRYMLRSIFVKALIKKRKELLAAELEIKPVPEKRLSSSDIALYLKWARVKGGDAFTALYDKGDISRYGNDDSSADLALCCMLAYYLQGDAVAVDTAFRHSALYRDKWEREDYRDSTISRGIEQCKGVFYTRPGRPSKSIQSSGKESEVKNVTVPSKAEHLDNIENVMMKSTHFSLVHLEQAMAELKINVRLDDILHDVDIVGVPNRYFRADVNLTTVMNFLFDYIRAAHSYKYVTRASVTSYLKEAALKNRFNPVLDYLAQFKWDGQDHLQKVYDALGIKDNLSKTLIKKWFWQGHALLRNDGTISPAGILVFQGPQGIGKTTFFSKAALQARWFGQGSIISGVDKDLVRRTVSHFISELGELSGTLSRTDRNLLKIFVDRTKDTYRLPYDSTDTVHARRTNLCATVNENVFLVDPTGNRRFWTICLKSINKALINSIDFTQVWLQVWEQYAKDDLLGFRLTEEELSAVNNVNTQYEKSLEGEDEVRDIFSSDEVEYKYATVAVFKEAWPILRKYTARQLGMILDRLQIKQNIKTVKEGYRKYKTGRYRALPLPIYKSEGRGQRNDWSHLPSCPLDEIVRFGTEEQGNTLTPPELNLQPQRLKKSLRYKGKTIVYKTHST